MKLSRREFLGRASVGAAAIMAMPGMAKAEQKPIRLFNGTNLDGWYSYTPQTKFENPGIFTVVDGMLRISGGSGDEAYYGGLITKGSFSNYKLTFDYKWGGPTYGKRKDKARDSGVLLHAVGPNEPGPWMTSYEFQIIEGGTGDILVVPTNGRVDDAGKPVDLELTAEIVVDGKAKIWHQGAEKTVFKSGRVNWYGRDPDWKDTVGFRGRQDVESKLGEWTHCEGHLQKRYARVSGQWHAGKQGVRAVGNPREVALPDRRGRSVVSRHLAHAVGRVAHAVRQPQSGWLTVASEIVQDHRCATAISDQWPVAAGCG